MALANIARNRVRVDLSECESAREPGLVVYQHTNGVDAIDEYSRRLVQALGKIGTPARYAPDGIPSVCHLSHKTPWVLLQYNPLSYGRWGLAPMVIGHAIALRQRNGARFIVSVHEPWVEIYGWRSALMSFYQRVQLQALLRAADGIITMTESLASTIGRGAVPIPVGTTITPVTTDATAGSERFQLRDRFVVALFGRGHPSRALDYAELAINKLLATAVGERLSILNLGDRAPELALPPHVDVRTLGHLDAVELSHALCASHLLLLPFTDGVSTRRTTLMAGLAHGVPVVGLRGSNTDGVLTHSDALLLTPVGDRSVFARAVAELANDDARLRRLGDAGRQLYLERFDWPVVARSVLDVVTVPR